MARSLRGRYTKVAAAGEDVARCVRRAWLWGFDDYAGRGYSHRKEWVLERLVQLTSIFVSETSDARILAYRQL